MGSCFLVFDGGSEEDVPPFYGVGGYSLESCPAPRRRGASAEGAKSHMRTMMDLMNALYNPDVGRTFALRVSTRPNARSTADSRLRVDLLFRCAGGTEQEARDAAQICSAELGALLGGWLPDHGWRPYRREEDLWSAWHSPCDSPGDVIEIRRREELVVLETLRPRPALGRSRQAPDSMTALDKAVYFVHSFLPRPDCLDSLIRTMLLSESPLTWQVAIRPVRLEDSEEDALLEEIAKCEGYQLSGSASLPAAYRSAQTVHIRRAKLVGESLVDALTRLADAPFLLHICLASPHPIPRSIAEAAGVAVTAPVGWTGSPEDSWQAPTTWEAGGYDVAKPRTDEEKRIAWQNFARLGFEPWGPNLAPERLIRLKQMLDASEAVGAFRLPLVTEEGFSGIPVRAVRNRPLPAEIAALSTPSGPGALYRLGSNRYLGFENSVCLPREDRSRHVYVIGQTGSGKTTLLRNMILSDMEAGHGLAVLDPHGDLFEDLLGEISQSRKQDVVLLDPSDLDYPVGFNLLECAEERQRHFVAREMKDIMAKLLADQYAHQAVEYAGPVFYQHMQMNLLLAMSRPTSPGTLLEFYEIYQHEKYWRRWLPLQWDEPQLVRWVNCNLPNIDYTKRSSSDLTFGEYLSSKFDDFVFDPMLRCIFGQRHSTIDLREIIDSGKILLVNLGKGILSEANARFLGMVLLAKLLATAFSRAKSPPSRRRVFYLYVDEFQSVATQSFVTLLSEARKYGIGLVLANQFLSQIKEERIIQAVFGNVGTLVSFRVGRQDAELLAPQFEPYLDAYDLVNLPNWCACVKTSVRGEVVPPFTINTDPPASLTGRASREEVRCLSRSKYGRPREQVLKEIQEQLTHSDQPPEEGFQLPKFLTD